MKRAEWSCEITGRPNIARRTRRLDFSWTPDTGIGVLPAATERRLEIL